jgi:hypothetical protein
MSAFPDIHEPWGEDCEWYVAPGHIPEADAWKRFKDAHRSLLCDPDDLDGSEVVHGYATQGDEDHPVWGVEWWWFHRKSVEGSEPVTILLLPWLGLRDYPPAAVPEGNNDGDK